MVNESDSPHSGLAKITMSSDASKMHLLEPRLPQLRSWLQERNYPAFRAVQVAHWLFEGRGESFADMTDLPQAMRAELADDFLLWTTQTVKHSQSGDGSEKLLLQLQDNGHIECVLLRDGIRRTICISSQVGCAMGCVFCASGLDGVDRNLTSAEIIEQMLRLQRLLPADERLSHIVVMGMGEPLANLDALLPALEVARDPQGLGISARRITISTVGLPPAIRRLSQREVHYQLAVSLHAANDALRNQLVPVNDRIGLSAILSAADDYFATSGRRLTFEYVLLAGVNDNETDAYQLAALLKGRPALLNVIPYNPVQGLPYKTPSTASQKRFRDILVAAGLEVKFRVRKGDKINAACGQLRRIEVTSIDAE
jgi:23S rRNA (adenine2503-C2)-methyltransferase